MTVNQIIGLGVLVLVAALAFWLMSGGRKVRPSGNRDSGDHNVYPGGGDSHGPSGGD